MKLLLSLARTSRLVLTCALLCSVLGGVGGSWLVAAIHRALDAGVEQLPRLGLEFAALSVAVLLLRWAARALFVELSQATLDELRRRIGSHLARVPYREIEERGAARLLAVLTEDVATVSEFFVLVPRLVMQGAVVAGCLGYLALISWRAFCFALITVLIGSCARYLGTRRANQHLRTARQAEDDLFKAFRALFSGAKELKQHAARRRAFSADVLGASIEHVRRERTRGDELHQASVHWGVLLFYVVIGGVLFLPASALGTDAGARAGYALIFLYVMLPVHSLLEALPEVGRTRVALERISDLGAGGGAAPEPLPAAPPAFSGLRLREVTHRYRRDNQEGTFVLGPVTLDLGPGEVVFLIGGNGSGKTTLAKLLVGLYEPETGEVLLNGALVGAAEREAYRQRFSAVFADYHLFEGLFGVSAERAQGATELLDALGLAHKVSVHDGAFSTTQLSTGQRKRLALLVAMLEDRPVVVFDEWAADQDPEYKEVFYRRVLPELARQGKAVVVISHDDRYYEAGDRCLELKDGRLRPRQSGTRALGALEGALA